MPGEILSPAQASTFLACGARYWFRYGEGRPDPIAGGGVRGRAVHSVVERAMRAKIAGVILDPAELPGEWPAIWEEAADGAEFEAGENIDAASASALQLAGMYLTEVAPRIDPAAVEVPVSGVIAGVKVRGIVDIVERSGRICDLKTVKRRPSKLDPQYALQLATYVELTPEASGEARVDHLIANKRADLVSIDYAPAAAGRKLVETLYPMVAEGIAGGLFTPNRTSRACGRKYCAYAAACEREFGGTVE
jgi:PD-(D/E)XK nuclease superfamily